VVRGGSWNNNERNARAANRNNNDPANANDNIGFRCARSLSRGDLPGLNAVRPRAADRAQENERRQFLAASCACPGWTQARDRANRKGPCPLW
jgi:hypothetical protein